MTFNQLPNNKKESFKFQFARDVTGKLTRKEIMALFCLTVLQSNSDLKQIKEMPWKFAEAHILTSKLIMKHVLNELDIDWKGKIDELCKDFECAMTVTECSDLLINYIEQSCAENFNE